MITKQFLTKDEASIYINKIAHHTLSQKDIITLAFILGDYARLSKIENEIVHLEQKQQQEPDSSFLNYFI